MNNHTDWS